MTRGEGQQPPNIWLHHLWTAPYRWLLSLYHVVHMCHGVEEEGAEKTFIELIILACIVLKTFMYCFWKPSHIDFENMHVFLKKNMYCFENNNANIISSMNMSFQLLPLQHHVAHSLLVLKTIHANIISSMNMSWIKFFKSVSMLCSQRIPLWHKAGVSIFST